MNRLLAAVAALTLAAPLIAADPIKVLIVDGQNNHNSKATTPLLKKILEDAKVFSAEVATAPTKPSAPPKPKDANNEEAQKAHAEALAKSQNAVDQYRRDMAAFHPNFKDFQVVVSNYN